MKICIDQEWYDLSKWSARHPGGVRILERFHGQDATDHFYCLHSKRAIKMLKHFPIAETKEDVPPVAQIDQDFRDFKKKLEADGWWERNMFWEWALLLPVLAMIIVGTMIAAEHPILATLILGVAIQQAGWLGHDMAHARDSKLNSMLVRVTGGWIIGFDNHWWSEKHNTHHALTNHMQHDSDIHNQPYLFLWAPLQKYDHVLRRYQHLYFPILYSFLHMSWRIDSVLWAVQHRNWKSLLFDLLPSYLCILFGGFLVAIVVTMSHESETIFMEREPSFVKNQFESTRNVDCPDWVTEYLFGGMQYQLEHHLFPTLPRYKHRFLKPLVMQWAKQHGLVYKSDGLWTMLGEHYNTLKRAAELPSRPDTNCDTFVLTQTMIVPVICEGSVEHAMIQLQGKLELTAAQKEGSDALADFASLPLGLIEVNGKTASLTIGQHRLKGKVQSLPKPFALMKKGGGASPEYRIQGMVTKKIVFNTRPKPLVTKLTTA